MKAIVVNQVGDPDQLIYQNVEAPAPGPGQVLVKVQAIGVNFIDIYHRTGLYPKPLPFTPGIEGSGEVSACGEGVDGLEIGTPVGFVDAIGAYAEYTLVPADRLIPLPEKVDFPSAAAALLQGMTAHYLVHGVFPVAPGHVALVHAAAGGVGLLLTQMIKSLGGLVVATVSTAEKAAAATEAGADLVVKYNKQDFSQAARDFTGGLGVDVVYDSVGKDTFEGSINSLRPRGMMVTFGNASGPVPPTAPLLLSQKGSLFLTRPTLAHYTATRQELLERANEVLTDVAYEKLSLTIGADFPLADAAKAHTELAARRTMGKLLLIP
jgi:NADPH:quinone reductase